MTPLEFKKLVHRLTSRSNRTDWPDYPSEYWADLERSLAETGCTADQADRAVSTVCNLPNLFPSDYRPRLLEAVRTIQTYDQAPRDVALGGRKLAEEVSQSCPECGGSGQSFRYVHADNRNLFRGDPPVGNSFVGPCGSCPLGRWLAARDRTTTWADRPGLAHPGKACHRPSQWDEANDRPLPDPDPADLFDPDRLRASARGPRARQDVPRALIPTARRSRRGDAAEATGGRPPVPDDPILDRESQPF